MSWFKITFAVNSEQLDDVTEQLEHAGSQAVTIEDAGDHALFDLLDGESPVWQHSLITGLFLAETGLDNVLAKLTHSFAPQSLPEYRVEALPDQDWERSWMDRFHPMQYGKGLWICPSWCEPPDADATNIMLDPGLAFGSGSHETTGLCLQWLAQQEMSGKTIIDYGCGSGILAIAALKLGAETALGVDIDKQALRASRDNARINQVSDNLQLEFPENIAEQSVADIVFANILAGTILELKNQLLTYRAAGGVLILSGILDSQQALIVKEFEAENNIEVFSDGDWLMMSVTAQCSQSQSV